MSEQRGAHTAVLSRPRLGAVVLLAATALGLYLCYRIAQPFLPALSWGLALAVVGYPIHKFICRRLPHPTLSAALTVSVIAVVIIAPVAFVAEGRGALRRHEKCSACGKPRLLCGLAAR